MSYASELPDQIDPGHFRLEGSIGRGLMAALRAGEAILADHPARDYWGNVIPAWWMVAEDSPGSPELYGVERPPAPELSERRAMLTEIGMEER